MGRVRWGLQLDYSLMLQQAVFSTPPLYCLDLITGDGLGVDTELVSLSTEGEQRKPFSRPDAAVLVC